MEYSRKSRFVKRQHFLQKHTTHRMSRLSKHPCLQKRWSTRHTRRMNSWCLLILIMNTPHPAKKGSSLICGSPFSHSVPPKSPHSLPARPDLHMKWYPSFSSTPAPLRAHMPGSEEAGKTHNWSVSLGWKSVTRVSPPRSLQDCPDVQISQEFCRANTDFKKYRHNLVSVNIVTFYYSN